VPKHRTQPEKASFGLDAPAVPAALTAAGAATAGAAVLLRRRTHRWWPTAVAAGYASCFAITSSFYLHTSLRGKFMVWNRLLDQLHLSGNEHVVDLGCGRGAVLLAAARRLPTGRAIGVDLWRTGDQSGNAADRTWANAHALGIADRVVLHTADLAAMPLDDASADVVVSSLAIHNITDPEHRARAIAEAIRVLRPGGRLLIADFRHTADYQRQLLDAGMESVQRRPLGWRFWYGNPWAGTDLISGTRPNL
jgi:ubiquinone/menaquinone biosynthesis C-methylase UbiE